MIDPFLAAGLALGQSGALPRIKEGSRLLTIARDPKFVALLDAYSEADRAAHRADGGRGTGLSAVKAQTELVNYLDGLLIGAPAASGVAAELTDEQIKALASEYEKRTRKLFGETVFSEQRLIEFARAVLAKAAPVASLSEAQQFRTGYGEGVRAAAKLCHGLELTTLAEHIRNLQSAAPAAPVAAASQWISVDERLPECNMTPGSLGVEVLVFPQPERGYHTAFYGCRVEDKPCFYWAGTRTNGVTHWQPIPAAPTVAVDGS